MCCPDVWLNPRGPELDFMPPWVGHSRRRMHDLTVEEPNQGFRKLFDILRRPDSECFSIR